LLQLVGTVQWCADWGVSKMLQKTRDLVRLLGALLAGFGGSCLAAGNRGAQRATIAHMKSSFVVVVLALLPTLALGQSMRCGSELITKGTSQAKVAALCGQPTQVVHPPAYDGVVPGVSDVQDEIWTYNLGPNKQIQRIWFRNGTVANIDSVGYGWASH
jgi:hypothetical protein